MLGYLILFSDLILVMAFQIIGDHAHSESHQYLLLVIWQEEHFVTEFSETSPRGSGLGEHVCSVFVFQVI